MHNDNLQEILSIIEFKNAIREQKYKTDLLVTLASQLLNDYSLRGLILDLEELLKGREKRKNLSRGNKNGRN